MNNTFYRSLLYNTVVLCAVLLASCSAAENKKTKIATTPYVMVLGIAQDAGYPQANCYKKCCRPAWKQPVKRKPVSCIALVDPVTNQRWMFDCTPDFTTQLQMLHKKTKTNSNKIVDGIFLSHAHIGHYTGLMYLGRECMNAQEVPVFVMPRMQTFLMNNGPWSQLVSLKNIQLNPIKADSVIRLNERISVTVFTVPHRDEFSETVGFRIQTKNKSLVFIPDIDKWSKWNKDLLSVLHTNDYLLIDGTFYKNGEIAGRNMNEIPHPFIEETMQLCAQEKTTEKQKIFFIHLNHTNPALRKGSSAQREIRQKGFNLAKQFQILEL